MVCVPPQNSLKKDYLHDSLFPNPLLQLKGNVDLMGNHGSPQKASYCD